MSEDERSPQQPASPGPSPWANPDPGPSTDARGWSGYPPVGGAQPVTGPPAAGPPAAGFPPAGGGPTVAAGGPPVAGSGPPVVGGGPTMAGGSPPAFGGGPPVGGGFPAGHAGVPTYHAEPETTAYPWAPQPPRSRGGGGSGRALLAVLMVALMGLSALGGGVAGAWFYAQSQDGAGNGASGVTVVDGPQLDYTSLASIAAEVGPSVVQIQAGEGSGSGVVMSDDGYVLTNAHVVAVAPGDQVSVRFSNGETAPATIVGADARTDIAVVRVQGAADLVPARFGDSDQVLVGDTVLAIGSPLGFQGSVTQGIISARDRTLPVGGSAEQRRSLSGLLQTDASINPGNSGGPLVNLDGEVIGINTAIATDGEASGFLGLGFAVPSNRATDVADQLIAGEEVSHAFLGVSVTPVDTGGALIGEVVPGSPADTAGLQEGDIVVRVGDRPITDSSDLVNIVHSSQPGDTLEVEFERDGSRQSTTVTLAEAGD